MLRRGIGGVMIDGALAIAGHSHNATAQDVSAIVGIVDSEILAGTKNSNGILRGSQVSEAGGHYGSKKKFADHLVTSAKQGGVLSLLMPFSLRLDHRLGQFL
jgi:hypothetical protein